MHKIIYIFISSLLLIPAMNFVGVSNADARNYNQQRQVRRAYVAGAIRGNRRSHVSKQVKKQHRRARTRRAVRGAVRLGVGAPLINNAHDRYRDHD